MWFDQVQHDSAAPQTTHANKKMNQHFFETINKYYNPSHGLDSIHSCCSGSNHRHIDMTDYVFKSMGLTGWL